MSDDRILALMFVTDNGKKERMHLDHSNLTEARKKAEEVMRRAGGLYKEVEIHSDGSPIETIRAGEAITEPIDSTTLE